MLGRDNLEKRSVDELHILYNNCIEAIKNDRQRFHLKTGRKWSQANLAEFVDTTIRRFSTARGDSFKDNRNANEYYLDIINKFIEEFTLMINADLSVSSYHPTALDALAHKLSLNLIDVSTSFSEKEKPYKKILQYKHLIEHKNKEEKCKRERVIAIIGAGASYAATPKENPIPLSKDAILHLKKVFEKKIDNELLEDEIHRLNSLMRNSAREPSFETHLLAFSKFSSKTVVEELKKLCGNRNTPSLVYEIIAHLLKHRFIDAILNFNYDELLDNAIEEEIPHSDDYRFIYSAGHCPKDLNELRIDNRLKQPIYIKCNGTISQPNSLRFTGDKAFLMEGAIQEHIIDLFKGEVVNQQQKYLPLNLIIIGFSMRNHALNQIIEDNLTNNQEKTTLWLINPEDDIENRVIQRFKSKFIPNSNKLEVKTVELIDENLEKTLITLWDKTSECFKEPYQPRGIARHQFINHFFKDLSPLDVHGVSKTNIIEYYQDRLLIELCIIILQSNGIIHLSQLSGSRAGKFFDLLKKERHTRHISEYLKDLGLRPYESFMYDTYLVQDHEAFSDPDLLIEYLRDNLLKSLNSEGGRRRYLQESNSNIFKKLSKDIRKRRLLNVNPKYTNIHDNLFAWVENHDVMSTSLAWIYNYRKNIESNLDKWDLMLTVSEEGRFLVKDLREGRFENKFFEIVLGSYGIPTFSNPKTREKLESLNLLSDKPLYRPWWMHNKHQVLFMKRLKNRYTGNWKKDWVLVQGFFYRQSMLSRRVNPVRIKKKKDLEKLLYMFAIYWHGARNYSDTDITKEEQQHPGSLQMNIVNTEKQMNQIIKDLLKLYEDKVVRKK
ncbi:MAG: SIR2 family protein [Chitinophagales bacterium]|nr:SIR2 family protein [Chitinophagales bacterium]